MHRLAAGIVTCLAGAWALASAQTPPTLFTDRALAAGVGRVLDLAFSPDGRFLAAAGASGALAVFDSQTGTLIRQVPLAAGALTAVTFGGHGNVLAVGAERGVVTTLDLRTWGAQEVAHHGGAVTSIAFGPDGAVGASGDAAGDIQLWPAAGGVAAERLREDRERDPIVFLQFQSPSVLVAVAKDLRIVTWDVAKKRTLRRGTLQINVLGRTAELSAAGADPSVSQLGISTQYLSTPRGGVLAGHGMLARPEDLKRVNVIQPYALETGIAADAVQTGDYLAEHLTLSPGACYAIFSSFHRDRPVLHLWSLVKQGQDVLRVDLPARASALAVDPAARFVAAAVATGELRTWKASGATAADCQAVKSAGAAAPAPSGPKISVGDESRPLFAEGAGYRVAVLPFEVGGVADHLGQAVAEMVAGELSNSTSVVAIERTAIDAVVKELAVQRSGLTAADAARIGKGLNAQKVVLGSVRRFGEGTFVILARVVDVETQQIQGTRDVTCESCAEGDLPAAARALRRILVP